MEKKPPHDESKNRFAEVIRQSQERRAELNNKAKNLAGGILAWSDRIDPKVPKY
jgi:hypothetical protein